MADARKTQLDSGLSIFSLDEDFAALDLFVPPLCITKEQMDEGQTLVYKNSDFADRKVK